MIKKIVTTLLGILLLLPIIFVINTLHRMSLKTISVSTSSISEYNESVYFSYPEKIYAAPSERNISLVSYPGLTSESSEVLIMIMNPTSSEIAILVDFLVMKEGFVENFGEYRFNITGNVRILSSDPSKDYFIFVIEPFGVANIIITYTIIFPHNLVPGKEFGRFSIYTERFERLFRTFIYKIY